MKKQKWGRIINLSSVAGLVGLKMSAAYPASKHGVIGLTKAIALECAGLGITVNSICPGYAYTPLVQRSIQSRMKELSLS